MGSTALSLGWPTLLAALALVICPSLPARPGGVQREMAQPGHGWEENGSPSWPPRGATGCRASTVPPLLPDWQEVTGSRRGPHSVSEAVLLPAKPTGESLEDPLSQVVLQTPAWE